MTCTFTLDRQRGNLYQSATLFLVPPRCVALRRLFDHGSCVPQPKSPSAAAAEVGRRLKQARDAKGFNQLDLAYLAGVTTSSISAYENGHKLPSVATLLDLAHVLGIDPGTLISKIPPDVPPGDKLAR